MVEHFDVLYWDPSNQSYDALHLDPTKSLPLENSHIASSPSMNNALHTDVFLASCPAG